MTLKLWHCKGTRSLRPLWALEEMGLEYELEVLSFPPRVLDREFLKINPLGTIPYFSDGNINMTESTGICHYLAEKYQKHKFVIKPDHLEYGDYLNWLYHSDATLTFPQTLYLRYEMFENKDRKQPQVAQDYRKWYLARLRKLTAHIRGREFLCDERFTIADIAIAYALVLGKMSGIADDYDPEITKYMNRMTARPGFIRAQER